MKFTNYNTDRMPLHSHPVCTAVQWCHGILVLNLHWITVEHTSGYIWYIRCVGTSVLKVLQVAMKLRMCREYKYLRTFKCVGNDDNSNNNTLTSEVMVGASVLLTFTGGPLGSDRSWEQQKLRSKYSSRTQGICNHPSLPPAWSFPLPLGCN